MVLAYPFAWPLWNAAENSQRQVCKQSLTLSESTTRDGLCSASDTPQEALRPTYWHYFYPPQTFLRATSSILTYKLRGAKRWNNGNRVLITMSGSTKAASSRQQT